MEKNSPTIGIVNVFVLLAAGIASLALALYDGTFAGQIVAVFFAAGFLTAVVGLIQMRLEEKERLERLDFDEMNKTSKSSSLFTGAEEEVLQAKQSRLTFEKYFIPGFAILLIISLGAASYLLMQWLRDAAITPPRDPMVALSLFATVAIILFVLGKYAANLSKLQGLRLLRPAASYLVLGFYLCTAVAISIGWAWSGGAKADMWLAKALTALLAVISAELVVNLILEIYRPRHRKQAARLVYESRLVGLLGQPEGLFTTASQALDYQFGFKVSETGFYLFMQRNLARIVLLQMAVLLISTSIVFISPGEQGLIERFGRATSDNNILDPGPHLKLPWPIDQVYRFRTQEIQSFNVGFQTDEKEEHNKGPILWTVKHYKEEFNLLVASREQTQSSTNLSERSAPADLLTVSIPVQFLIQDLRAWAYQHTDAARLLEKAATREVILYLVGVDIFDIMSHGRTKAAEDLRGLIQKRADDLHLGVKILFVGLQDIHPPVKVAASFEAVVGSKQDNEAKLRISEGYASRTVALAKAEADKKEREAESYSIRKIAGSAAQAKQFESQLLAYQAAPEVYAQRAYLQSFARGSTNSRKYIITATNSQETVILNLEDKIRQDILDIPLPSKR